jgi:hypothetical protein
MIRATCVTDRSLPVVTVTTQLRREEYNALNDIARKRQTTKAEIIRGLIQDLLRAE